ncbi:MAG TPA: hypothetical protein DCK99_09715 [Blastocatellia bacterium]|jgi:predicted S18 family serine protease|nr:hypothetical protein [Blastocatellia bacterium]
MRSTQKPTELAEHLLGLAWSQSNEITDFEHLGRALGNLSLGLINMCVGLRATYIKLEEVEAEIQQLKRQSDRAEALSRYQQPIPPMKK